MSHITITMYDHDGQSGERTKRAELETEQTEADYHVRSGIAPQWPPCRCPVHLNPETGEGTPLKLSGLRLVRPSDAC